MRETLEKLFLRTLEAIALERVMPRKVSCSGGVLTLGTERIELGAFDELVVVALGKAAFPMVEILAGMLPSRPLSGVATGVLSTRNSSASVFEGLACFDGGHPYPNHDSFASADAALEALRGAGSSDLVLYLLSGGGSSMCERPICPQISRRDCTRLYELLVTCGLTVLEINFIRKHLSAIKGGRMSQAAYPARQVTLFVSDVPPGSPSNVASGPTMPDDSSVDDCVEIIRRAGLMERLPVSIRDLFAQGRVPETPKRGAQVFRASSWHCLLTPEDAATTLADSVQMQGWHLVTDLSVEDDWSLERVTDHLLAKLRTLQSEHPGEIVAVVSGGEYSCPVLGDGAGGRNQAFVLECVPKIAGKNLAVLSAGTDGIDGNSPAAGAVADGTSLERALAAGLDPAETARRSDSHIFFDQLGDTVLTGPTGNNVRDLRLLVAW